MRRLLAGVFAAGLLALAGCCHTAGVCDCDSGGCCGESEGIIGAPPGGMPSWSAMPTQPMPKGETIPPPKDKTP